MKWWRFLAEENGGVSVDLVVLMAGIVGIGLAVVGTVSSGVSTTSDGIRAGLSRDLISARFDSALTDTFTGGAPHWTAGTVRAADGFGEMLVLDRDDRGAVAARAFDLGAGASQATLSFDMAFLDSWDGETGTVYLNGVPVLVGTRSHASGGVAFDDSALPHGVTATWEQSPRADHGGFASDYTDVPTRVTLTVADPGETIELGFSMTLDQRHTDESLAIDNVEVVATDRG